MTLELRRAIYEENIDIREEIVGIRSHLDLLSYEVCPDRAIDLELIEESDSERKGIAEESSFLIFSCHLDRHPIDRTGILSEYDFFFL
jgi:hypothetical protein